MNNFFKQTFASLIGSLLGLTIFSGIGFLGLLILVIIGAGSESAGPVIEDKSVLLFDLGIKITDSGPDSSQFLEKTLSGTEEDEISLRKVIESIDKATNDERIVAIYIAGNSRGGVGYASLKEIREALERFRAKGKKVIAYNTSWSEQEYYLSSVANQVVINPVGAMEVNGLSSQPIFLTGALKKYGIGVQVIRVGKFKGAVEPFILDKLSPENRQQTQKLLDDVWRKWRVDVGKSRKIPADKLQAIANGQPILEATQAKNNGLVDQIAYQDQVINELKKLTGKNVKDKTYPKISLTEYAQVPGKSLGINQESDNKIAVVYAEGEIVDGIGDDGEIGGDRYAKIFSKIREDKNIKAVVLRINSPGGSATASEIMQREIKLTRQAKPVIVSMGDIAASGGYWIATDSNRIFAESNTITGSIGVFGLLLNGQQLANNNGITWDAVKTSQYADTQSAARPKSAQEIALYQRTVNRTYYMFLQKVAQGRKLPIQKVAEIAQGRVWSGTAAKAIGLVDDIGGLDVAVKYAAKAAKLGNDWEIETYPEFSTFAERLFGKDLDKTYDKLEIIKSASSANNPMMKELSKLQEELNILQKMNDPQGVYTRLPFNIKIE